MPDYQCPQCGGGARCADGCVNGPLPPDEREVECLCGNNVGAECLLHKQVEGILPQPPVPPLAVCNRCGAMRGAFGACFNCHTSPTPQVGTSSPPPPPHVVKCGVCLHPIPVHSNSNLGAQVFDGFGMMYRCQDCASAERTPHGHRLVPGPYCAACLSCMDPSCCALSCLGSVEARQAATDACKKAHLPYRVTFHATALAKGAQTGRTGDTVASLEQMYESMGVSAVLLTATPNGDAPSLLRRSVPGVPNDALPEDTTVIETRLKTKLERYAELFKDFRTEDGKAIRGLVEYPEVRCPDCGNPILLGLERHMLKYGCNPCAEPGTWDPAAVSELLRRKLEAATKTSWPAETVAKFQELWDDMIHGRKPMPEVVCPGPGDTPMAYECAGCGGISESVKVPPQHTEGVGWRCSVCHEHDVRAHDRDQNGVCTRCHACGDEVCCRQDPVRCHGSAEARRARYDLIAGTKTASGPYETLKRALEQGTGEPLKGTPESFGTGMSDGFKRLLGVTPEAMAQPDEAEAEVQEHYAARERQREDEMTEVFTPIAGQRPGNQYGIRRLELGFLMLEQCREALGIKEPEPFATWIGREWERLGLPSDVTLLSVEGPGPASSRILILGSTTWGGVADMTMTVTRNEDRTREHPEHVRSSYEIVCESDGPVEPTSEAQAMNEVCEPPQGAADIAIERLASFIMSHVPGEPRGDVEDAGAVGTAIRLLRQKQIPASGLVLQIQDPGGDVIHRDRRERMRWGSHVYWNGKEILTLKRVTLDADGVPELVFSTEFKNVDTDRHALEELRGMGCRVLIEPDREGPTFGDSGEEPEA